MYRRVAAALLCALTALVHVPATGQQAPPPVHTLVFRGVALEHALEELVSVTQIDLMYDTALMRDATVFCVARDEPAEEILRCIVEAGDLDFYRLSSGTYVIIERAERAPQYGRLAGVVVDGDTGEPLPYANVFLADASTGTAANEAGMFHFASLLPGPNTVVTTYVGYEPAVDSVWIPPDGSVRRRIALRSRPLVTEPVVVNGLQQRLPSEGLGHGRIAPARFATDALGGTTDAVRSVQSLVGVAMRAPLADVHIQGGESGEHLLLLDGAPVFNPVSLGRLLGAFSPLALERLTVHKAGFGVAHGSRLSGVIVAEHDLVSRNRLVVAQADPLSFNARLGTRLRLPGDIESTAMVAARTSMWNSYRYPAIDALLRDWNTVDPVLTSTLLGVAPRNVRFTPHRHGSDLGYSDLHAALQMRFNPFHNLYASVYRGRNDVATELLTSDAASGGSEPAFLMLTRDRYRWNNLLGQLRHEWILGAHALSTIRLRAGTHTLVHRYEMADSESAGLPGGLTVPEIEEALVATLDAADTEDDNRISEVALETTLDYSLGARHHLHGGLDVIRVSNRLRIDSLFFQPLASSFSGWRLSGFVEDRFSPGWQTTLEAGVRLTYVPARRTVYAEPRFAIRYDASAGPLGGYSIRLAAGLYRQFVNQFDLSSVGPSAAVPSVRFWLPVDHSLAPPRAYHLAADLLLTPRPHWTINVEGYYKHLPSLLALDYTSLLHESERPHQATQAQYIGRSRGYGYGGGLRIERLDDHARLTLTYSYNASRRRFPSRFGGRLESSPWNEPHRVTVSGDVFISRTITARLRMRGVWGRAWGFRQAYYDFLAAHSLPDAYAPFDLRRPSDHTLPALYQLDAGLTYERAFNGVTLHVDADLLNALNRANVVDWSLTPLQDGFARDARTLPGRTPTLAVRLSY